LDTRSSILNRIHKQPHHHHIAIKKKKKKKKKIRAFDVVALFCVLRFFDISHNSNVVAFGKRLEPFRVRFESASAELYINIMQQTMASQTPTTPTATTNAGSSGPGATATGHGTPLFEAPKEHVSSTWSLSPHYYYTASVVNPTGNDLAKNPLLNRIGLEPMKRILLITASASFWGFMLGGVIGSRQSGMQYLAENAHRLPKNMEGWYFYHKKKNYRMIWGALRRGAVYSGKTGAMVGLFEVLEASADFYRGGADLFNSVMAGVASGAFFSAISKPSFFFWVCSCCSAC
jgi:hypothetical protein